MNEDENAKNEEIEDNKETEIKTGNNYNSDYFEYYHGWPYRDEMCHICEHWLGYDCGYPGGPCRYEPR